MSTTLEEIKQNVEELSGDMQSNETNVKTIDIYENLFGEDEIVFTCTCGKKHTSLRVKGSRS